VLVGIAAIGWAVESAEAPENAAKFAAPTLFGWFIGIYKRLILGHNLTQAIFLAWLLQACTQTSWIGTASCRKTAWILCLSWGERRRSNKPGPGFAKARKRLVI
jgi:hypothetical protein